MEALMDFKVDYLNKLLTEACLFRPNQANMNSATVTLERFGESTGLNMPHRFVIYGGQLMLESGEFRYDKEIWGPSPAQKRYEGRKDLGNIHPGDGKKFSGRGPIQITGRANYRSFTRWSRVLDPKCPDFTVNPELVNTDPWEGLSPIWFWRTNGLNAMADRGDVRAVTRRINGGYNHLAERIRYTDRLSLVTLGYSPANVRGFQRDADLKSDGILGPNTRAALHKALVNLK
jgi:putative chitinase